MRDAEPPEHLEHGRPRRQPAGAVADEAHRDLPGRADADLARGDEDHEAADQAVEDRLRRRHVEGDHVPLGPGDEFGRQSHQLRLAGSDEEADQCQQRHQDRAKQEHVPPMAVALPRAQQEMDADHAVRPDQQQQQRLGQHRIGPQPPQHGVIALVDVEISAHHPGVDDVVDQQQRNRETERDLQHLAGRHLEGAAFGDPQQGKERMDHEGAVERHRADPAMPEPVAPVLDRLHRLDAEDSDGVVEEMRGREGEQDESRGQADIPAPGRDMLHAGAHGASTGTGILWQAHGWTRSLKPVRRPAARWRGGRPDPQGRG